MKCNGERSGTYYKLRKVIKAMKHSEVHLCQQTYVLAT